MRAAYYVLPLIFSLLGCLLLFSKHPLCDAFIEGAREGLSGALQLLPTLILLLCAVSFFHASGGAEWLTARLLPLCARLGIPEELVPLLILRPMSGSAANAVAADLFANVGADSFVGRTASVIMGSSDTFFYIAAVYFSAAGVKKSRHAIPAALAVMVFCVFFSCILCRLL